MTKLQECIHLVETDMFANPTKISETRASCLIPLVTESYNIYMVTTDFLTRLVDSM